MNVILDNIIFSLQPTGGISVVWSELLQRAIKDSDIQLTILDYPHQNTQRALLNLSPSNVCSLPLRKLERYRVPNFTPSKDTIFHSSYFRILPYSGVHNVTTIHDLTYHYYRHGLAKAVHLQEERYAIHHSQKIICVSEYTKNDLLRIYPTVDEAQINVVYNGVSDIFRPTKQNNITPFETGSYLLFVGHRHAQYKNFDVAVSVAQQAKMPLVIVGPSLTSSEKIYLSEQLGEHNYFNHCLVNEQQLNAIYNHAFALIYPSEYEGFGLPIIEAQQCGCPVLIQKASSLPEIAGDGAIIVEYEKNHQCLTSSMAAMVNRMHQGQISLSDLQQRGFSNAQRFSWQKCYEQTKQVYQSI